MTEHHLKIAVSKVHELCDGCNQAIAPETSFITGIESCCGTGPSSCKRRLCEPCVTDALSMLWGVGMAAFQVIPIPPLSPDSSSRARERVGVDHAWPTQLR